MSLVSEATRQAKKIKSLVRGAHVLSLAAQKRGRRENVVYELWVNLSVLLDLQKHWSLRLVNSANGRWVSLPIAPAKKANFPYFVASDPNGNDAFQICLGTEIEMLDGNSFAPDLSIQHPKAGDSPSGSDVVFCWDQKHTESAERLDRDEVMKFKGYVVDHIVPTATIPQAPFQSGSPWPNKHAVVTNADYSTLKKGALVRMNVSEVADAKPGCASKRRP